MLDVKIINTFSKRKVGKRKKKQLSIFESGLKVNDSGGDKICPICKKKVSGFCKSHSLPKFVLKHLADNGNIKIGKSFQSGTYKNLFGGSNTLIFNSICRECDSSFFQDYENEDIFRNKMSDVAINEIAIKSYFRYLYRQQKEVVRFRKLIEKEKHEDARSFYLNQLFLAKTNVEDTLNKLDKCLKEKNKHNYYVIDEIDLNYQTELAYQGFVTPVYGFDELINNVYDYNLKNKIYQLGVCVFPHKNGTKILLFCEEGATKLKYFYKKYRTLNLNQKLYVINYMLLLFEEEWAVNGLFKTKLNKDTLLLINQRDVVYQITDNPFELLDASSMVESTKETFSLKTGGNIYNFLANHNSDN